MIFFSSNLVKLDLDLDPDPVPHSEKLLDRDPHKMNADPQPWQEGQRHRSHCSLNQQGARVGVLPYS